MYSAAVLCLYIKDLDEDIIGRVERMKIGHTHRDAVVSFTRKDIREQPEKDCFLKAAIVS